MKKIALVLTLIFTMMTCSSDDDNTPNTEPQKGDAVTIEQIVGTYKASEKIYDNTDLGFFKDNIELKFNSDYTGEEWNPRTLDKLPFTWSYNDRVISFSNSLHKNVKGWFNNSNLLYKAYDIDDSGKQTNNIATYTFVKK